MHVSAIACVSRDSGRLSDQISASRCQGCRSPACFEVDTCIDVTEPFGPSGVGSTWPLRDPQLSSGEAALFDRCGNIAPAFPEKQCWNCQLTVKRRSFGVRSSSMIESRQARLYNAFGSLSSTLCPFPSCCSWMFFVEHFGVGWKWRVEDGARNNGTPRASIIQSDPNWVWIKYWGSSFNPVWALLPECFTLLVRASGHL